MSLCQQRHFSRSGFTLIELSIVLVIIGLIVGGVLVGQHLIASSEVRATVTQVEQFQTAVATFKEKYGGLPGDLDVASAATYGFMARGANPGQGDGNGMLEGVTNNSGGHDPINQAAGETMVFWSDLTYANGMNVNLIEGKFSAAGFAQNCANNISGTVVGSYFPPAKIGRGNHWYVFHNTNYGKNFFGIAANVTVIGGCGWFNSTPGLSVAQAYAIDQKMDDGMPQYGSVMPFYIRDPGGGAGIGWANGSGNGGVPYVTSTPASSSTCFDNGNASGTRQNYSMTTNSGRGVNCALSFAISTP